MSTMRFLIAAGGARHSQQAVHTGLALAHAIGAEAVVLWVTRTGTERTAASVWRAAGINPAEVTVPLRAKIRTGAVVPEILAELAAGRYDLLILGERRPHRLLTRILGSVVDRVAGHAPCAVLIVRGMPVAYHRVLICDSGGATPSVVDVWLNRGLTQLASTNATVTILHVMSQISAGPGVDDTDLVAPAEEIIRSGAHEGQFLMHDLHALEGYSFLVRPRIRHGFVIDEIVAEADASDADLVVLGAHRAHGLQGRLVANLAKEIAARVARSVLIVR